jgi:hypothetical protein
MMFNNPFKLPTYSEWKESVEKIQCRCNEVLERLVLTDIKKNLDK